VKLTYSSTISGCQLGGSQWLDSRPLCLFPWQTRMSAAASQMGSFYRWDGEGWKYTRYT